MWKNILKARKVIKLGAKWPVGDGYSIQVYDDNWIPGDHGGRVTSPYSALRTNALVSDLIDPVTKLVELQLY